MVLIKKSRKCVANFNRAEVEQDRGIDINCI